MTARPITLEVGDSHLYPGARGSAFDLGDIASLTVCRPCVVAFADRTVVHGSIEARGREDFVLWIPSYVTARGARIPAKSWLVAIASVEGGGAALRVRKRL